LSEVARVFREEWGRAVSILIRVLGDFELAEDAVQDAFATAAERWPRDGTPRNPGAWIVTTARNRAIDRIRRERTLARKREELVAALERLPGHEEEDDVSAIPDDRLALVFTCCHPALAAESRVALTLREVGGLTTGEIAHEGDQFGRGALVDLVGAVHRQDEPVGVPVGEQVHAGGNHQRDRRARPAADEEANRHEQAGEARQQNGRAPVVHRKSPVAGSLRTPVAPARISWEQRGPRSRPVRRSAARGP